ncbi:hypothetical protein M3T53_09455 [Actinomyces sp. B33]|uniref:hypothetical protein n=1 Tax=Actinomyces sp. B33 TaxID=2942131 RepID=UPI002340CDB6|nr:hypothetical protein [Actinomyces sp. B33]MDC4233920.1 hypothetical protein [Actinomyces sp. B33]
MPQDPASVPSLRAAIGEARLKHYLDRYDGREDLALRLYMWNLELSSAFWGSLSLLEVTLRNRLQGAFRPYGLQGGWLASHLDRREREALTRAQDDLRRSLGAEPSDDDLVAGLSLGFWVGLLNAGQPRNRDLNYETVLWRPYLHKAFPNMPKDSGGYPSRRRAHTLLNGIRVFRNRVAHHEPVWRGRHREMLDSIVTVARYMDADVAAFMEQAQRVDEALNRQRIAVTDGVCVI